MILKKNRPFLHTLLGILVYIYKLMRYWFTLLISLVFVSCSSSTKAPPVPKEKMFSNNHQCSDCEYIYKATLPNGNTQETAIKNGKYNGMQREFKKKELVREVFFVENHKKGQEYFYENGEKKDSLYMDWLTGKTFIPDSMKSRMPSAVYRRFSPVLQQLAKTNPNGAYAEITAGRVTKIGEKKGEANNLYFEFLYEEKEPFKNYKLKSGSNYFIVKNDTIIEEIRFEKGNLTTDFKFRHHYNSFYANKSPKDKHEGDVAMPLDKATCIGKCHVLSYNEKGQKYIEYWQEITDSAGVKKDVITSRSYRNGTSLEFELHTLNGETISYKFFDDQGNLSTEYNKNEFYFIYNDKGNMMHEFLGTSRSEGKKIYYLNGTETIYLPNGLPFAIFEWKDGHGKQIK